MKTLIIFSVFIVIPELNRDFEDYYKSVKYLESSEVIVRKMLIRANKKRLILRMTDGSKWEVGRTYSKYFKKINSDSKPS